MAPPSGSSSKGPRPPGLSRHATPAEIQAHQLNKLLVNPEKPVHIPSRPSEGFNKSIRPPREMMKNVQGSSAGAGSGEFHVYKQSRRREYERLKLMDEEEAFIKEKQEAEERQRQAELAADEKTSKNRLKRQRKKDARSKHKGGAGEKEGDDHEGMQRSAQIAGEGTAGGNEVKKRKLAGGGAMKFKSAEEREVDDEEDEAAPRVTLPTKEEIEQQDAELARLKEEEERAKPAQEAGIKIQDDD